MTQARVMIIEDETLIAFDLRTQVEHMGHMVTSIYGSGEKALEEVANDNPDLVLMDIRLQGSLDGIETAEKMHQTCDVGIIYLTAFSEDSYLKRAKLTEPFGYMVKPVGEKDLHCAIEMALYKLQMEKQRRKMANELKIALDEVKALQGFLPICAKCKKIRDDQGYWNNLETYIEERSGAKFSHGMCPDCISKEYGNEEWYQEMKQNGDGNDG